MWSCDTGQRIPCFDIRQLTIIWNFVDKDNQGEMHTCSMICNFALNYLCAALCQLKTVFLLTNQNGEIFSCILIIRYHIISINNAIQAVALLLLFQHVSVLCLGFFGLILSISIFHCITLAVRTVLCSLVVTLSICWFFAIVCNMCLVSCGIPYLMLCYVCYCLR